MIHYLTKKQASKYLTQERGFPVSEKTLSKLISVGGSPIYQKFGARVLYTQKNLDDWANSRLSRPRANSSYEVENG